jgi:hypothetical protein
MVRRLIWITILISSLATFSQAQPGALPPTTQVYQSPVYVPSMPQVVGGYYVGYSGGGLYGITTPTASFASPQPTAGISLADRAGISTSSPIGTWVPSTLPPSTLVFTNVQPVVTEMALPEAEAGVVQGPVTAPRPNLGPSRWGGAAHVGAPASAAPPQVTAQSLGEVAAQHRTGAPPTIRRYTNADVQRILSTMPLRGINVNQRLQQQQAQPPAPAPPATAPRPQITPQPKAAPSPGSDRPRAAGEEMLEED